MAENVWLQKLVEDYCEDEKNIKALVYVENIDSFCRYDEARGFYRILKPRDFEKEIYQMLKKRMKKSIAASNITDAIKQIRWQIYNTVDNVFSNYIAFKDKLLNLTTFEYEEFDLNKMTFFSADVSAADVDLHTGKIPLFQKFLDEVIVDDKGKTDKQLQSIVQEMFGYCLLNTLEAHAAFFLVGDGSNGKSVILSILRQMIGEDFIASMSIETITMNQYAACSLIGKKLNICLEEESKYVKADKFKALISGDPVSAERKFGDTFSFTPTAKFVFATNEFPTFSSLNHGIVRRIKIIPFNKKISEKDKDTKLTGKLLKELPGIVAWSIEGAKRLVENNFVLSSSKLLEESTETLKENISSCVSFVHERYQEDKDYFISNDDLYIGYTAWCQTSGRKPLGQQNFIKDLKQACSLPGELKWSIEERTNKRGRHLKPRVDDYIPPPGEDERLPDFS